MTDHEKYVSKIMEARRIVRDMGLCGLSSRAASDNKSGLFPVQVVAKMTGKSEKELLKSFDEGYPQLWHHAKVNGEVIKVNYVHINC